ncbi:hypothetical protein [Acidiphilium iwatense]|uniref:Uncharacterized protein n=1 Tax=Acidiphilium iwatense TaxID=768198 RepID=A0ABS9DYX8_9PROT|nr:hypothetical protein [Acidiphilium iwatense]MCF3947962.1 hypothetical protein [Acidiphilium iwatense]
MQSLEGHSGPRQYLDAQFTWTRLDTVSIVLRSAFVGRRVYYAAIDPEPILDLLTPTDSEYARQWRADCRANAAARRARRVKPSPRAG